MKTIYNITSRSLYDNAQPSGSAFPLCKPAETYDFYVRFLLHKFAFNCSLVFFIHVNKIKRKILRQFQMKIRALRDINSVTGKRAHMFL